ncbi:hypothetical protein QR97_31295 [Streptomyces sp. PBH53]|nr:hypothetical protein QR97_31295 [Streptomyces sp. PBH53]
MVRFHTFAMAALAGIGDLPDTIMDRSVVMRIRRRRNGEKVSEFRAFPDTPALHVVRDRLAAWRRRKHCESWQAATPLKHGRVAKLLQTASTTMQKNNLEVPTLGDLAAVFHEPPPWLLIFHRAAERRANLAHV